MLRNTNRVLHVVDLGSGGFPSPFNSDGGVEARSCLPTVARVLHVVDLGSGGFPSPFKSFFLKFSNKFGWT